MNYTRRNFLKFAGSLILLPTVMNAVLSSKAQAEDCSALPLVEPGKDMAASVNYQANKAAIKDKNLKADRQGMKWDKQSCSNCMLYTACGKKGKDEVGKCTIFAGKAVVGAGWCSTWAKKG